MHYVIMSTILSYVVRVKLQSRAMAKLNDSSILRISIGKMECGKTCGECY